MLRIQLLGKVSLVCGSLAHDSFGYDKVRGLLGYLAAESGKWLRREALAELFWPNTAPEMARANLRRALFELRQILKSTGVNPLLANRNAVGIFPDRRVHIDLADFLADEADSRKTPEAMQTLERKVALYWGGFLEGIQIVDSPEFEHWLEVRREAILQRAIGMLDRLVGWYVQQGQRDSAIRHVRRKLELTPWVEANYCQLMQLLAEEGYHGQIWQTYLDCQRYLRHEMGLEPESRTTELARRLSREQLTLAASPALPQRSPLTVLACRISPTGGTTTEDYFFELAAAADGVREIVQRHNGWFSAIHANLLVAYFGFPKSREQATREAINSALEIRACIASFSPIECRLAINRGLSLLDERYAFPDVTGEVSQSAVAMLDTVLCNDIHVSARIFEQIGELIDGRMTADGSVCLQAGRERPLRRQGNRKHPLVGRRQEMHSLLQSWLAAASIGIAFVQLTGEPGIGKSRLIQAFTRQLRSRGVRTRTLYCLPETQHAPYQPIATSLARQFRDDHNLVLAERQVNLENRITNGPVFFADHRDVVCRLLGLSSSLDTIVDPRQLARRLEDGLIRLLDGLNAHEPLLLVLEDTHWCDNETLALLRRLAGERSRPVRQPLLVVTTSRTHDYIGDYAQQLTLNPLSAEETAELAGLLADRSFPEARIEDLVHRSDGVPLYVEQLVYAFKQGLVRQGVPENLNDLLAARIDAQGAYRRLAQQAALIGREFEPQLLAALWDDTEESLHAGLAALQRNGLIANVQTLPSFRHALIRDAALQSIPREERRRIRLRLAQVLRAHFAERIKQHPELLAIHLHDAEAPESAVTWLAAGRQATRASMQQQAAHFFRNGLEALRFIADAEQSRETEFLLLVNLGNALLATEGYGNAESRQLLADAMSLSKSLSNDIEVMRVLWGLWLGGRSAGSPEYPLELARHFEQAAKARYVDDPGIKLQVAYAHGNNTFWLARYAEARRHMENAVALGRHCDCALQIERFGENSAISALAFLSWIDWIEGDPAAALLNVEQAIAQARNFDHPHTLAFALTFAAMLGKHMRQPIMAKRHAEELFLLARSNGLQLWQAAATLVLGWASCAMGETSGLGRIMEAVEAARRVMSAAEATFLAFWLDALHLLGRLEEAQQLSTRCMTVVEQQDNYLVPEVLRLQGEIALARDSSNGKAARTLFKQALSCAEEQGATIFALRAAISLARHMPSAASRATLQRWFSRCRHGIYIPDFAQARALLEHDATG